MRVEDKLLILLSNNQIGRDKIEDSLFYDIDWNYFIKTADREGISGFIFYNIKNMKTLSIPHYYINLLEKRYYSNIGSNFIKLENLNTVINAFQKKKIKIVLLQGSSIIRKIYTSIGLRPIYDIDILIYEKDQDIVKSILSELGYYLISFYPYIFSNGILTLDIHTEVNSISISLSTRYAINSDIKGIWERAIPLDNGIFMLSPEDMIINLSAHLLKHSFERLIWFIDIVEIIRYYDNSLKWDEIIKRASESNLIKPLYFVLSYLRKYFMIEIPEDIIKNLSDIKLNFIDRKYLSDLLNNNRSCINSDLIYMLSINGIFNRIIFIIKTIFPNKEVMINIDSNPLIIGYTKRLFKHTLRFLYTLLIFIKDMIKTTV